MDQSIQADAMITGDIMLAGIILGMLLLIGYFTWPYIRYAWQQRRSNKRSTYMPEGGRYRK